MAGPVALDCDDDTEWEICEDSGFVYKRRRRRLASPPAKNILPESEADLLNKQRARKRRCLLSIRDKYRREFEQWEKLSLDLIRMVSSTPVEFGFEVGAASVGCLAGPSLDGLVLELEAQERAFGTLSELCDCVDLFCEALEDQLTQSLLDLPIWKSPKALMRSLCD